MIEQGEEINTWGKNVYVKNKFSGDVIKELNSKNIKLNIQKVIISIFAGRAGDTGKDPIRIYKKYKTSKKENLKM